MSTRTPDRRLKIILLFRAQLAASMIMVRVLVLVLPQVSVAYIVDGVGGGRISDGDRLDGED